MDKPAIVVLDADPERGARLRASFAEAGYPVDQGAGPSGRLVLVLPGSFETPGAVRARVERWYARSAAAEPVPRHDLVGGAELVGASDVLRTLRSRIAQFAPSTATVLVTGETGTGKELVAEQLHRNSRRAGAFVPVNCAAIPDGLLESELFGYERGAFTGASTAYEGKLRLAQGGTVLLDEVGDLSPYAQAKLLRALESREVYRLGGRRPVPLDVRVVAATNEDLERMVAEGRFRKDLYFRLNVARIHVPPLHERPEDVPPLLAHWSRNLPSRTGAGPLSFTREALERLMRYRWPGNVRELRNVVEVLALSVDGREVALADLPPFVRDDAERGAPGPEPPVPSRTERDRLLDALQSTRWNKSRAAQQLRWSRMTLYRKMAKYHIVESHVRPAPAPSGRNTS